jgi:uncharacterized membrane protein
MSKGRLEAFSDGVIAIIITIMVLELKVPQGASFADLLPLVPVFASYVLSFVFVGIYWNNHHHLLQAASHVDGRILWANLHLLFWLSLIPFATSWIGEYEFTTAPVAIYGMVCWLAGIAFTILSRLLIAHHGKLSLLGAAIGADTKGFISLGAYASGVALAFVAPTVSMLLYALVAVMWFIPDRRIERKIGEVEHASHPHEDDGVHPTHELQVPHDTSQAS